MIEQDLYWVLVQDRWVIEKGRHVTKYFAPLMSSLPRSVESFLIEYMFSKKMAKQTHAQGMGRHSVAEVQEMGMEDIEDLSNFLGTKDFMFGKNGPTEIDCVLFGFMVMFLYVTPSDNVYVKKIMKDHQNLVQFVDRMKEKFWPDWEDCRYKE